MMMWKGTGNTTTLLFSLHGLEILHQERRGQVNTIVMEHFNSILFHKSEPVNKRHTYQSINQLIKDHILLNSSLWFPPLPTFITCVFGYPSWYFILTCISSCFSHFYYHYQYRIDVIGIVSRSWIYFYIYDNIFCISNN